MGKGSFQSLDIGLYCHLADSALHHLLGHYPWPGSPVLQHDHRHIRSCRLRFYTGPAGLISSLSRTIPASLDVSPLNEPLKPGRKIVSIRISIATLSVTKNRVWGLILASCVRSCSVLQCPRNGAWRSLVARFNGVEEVVGSNPAAPTIIRTNAALRTRRFWYWLVLIW